ncbi:MAG: hypothetical protein AB1Z67_01415 [Candidatus Limnocylindrales bacterium]
MPKTIQIRDVDDAVYAGLAKRAAEAGLSVPDLLRREAARIAARPSMEEWLERTRRRPSGIRREQIVEALDEIRGPWPDADR